MSDIEITATPDDDNEPEDNWIAMDDPTYEVELYTALHTIGSENED